jgi:DNA polymerase II large subunit
VNDLEVISFDSKSHKANFEKISKIIRHKCDKRVYEIKTSDGWLKTTEDHSVFGFDFNSGKIKETKVGMLKKGDFILSLSKFDKKRDNILKGIYCSKLDILPDSRGHNISNWVPFNESFFRILGFIMAEGYIKGNKCEIGNTDKEIIKLLLCDLKNILGIEINYYEDKRNYKYSKGRYYRINIPSMFVKLLKNFGLKDVKAKNKEIIPLVFDTSPSNINAFLEGYCLGDGTSYLNDKNRKMIRLYTSSIKLASGLSLLAYLTQKKSTCRKSYDKSYKSEKYEVCISTFKPRSSFWSLYHFRSEINEGLKKSGLNDLQRKKLLANICLNKRLKSSSKEKIKKILESLELNSENTNTIKKLKNILEGDLRLEIVNEVKEIPYEGYVYDLEVPNKQNFLCGPHPIFAHNTMDVSLVLTSHLYLDQIDDEVHGMDIVSYYPLEFYEAGYNYESPKAVKIEKVEKRLDKEEVDDRYLGYGFTHNTDDMNNTILCSSYKSVPSMLDKLDLQLGLGKKIRAVNQDSVGTYVIDKHFMKDLKGNLRKFSQQNFRCTNCNTIYRRPPLNGKCSNCNMPSVNFTISEGSVKKYLAPSFKIVDEYKVDPYVAEMVDLVNLRIESVFGKEVEKQKDLNSFFKG